MQEQPRAVPADTKTVVTAMAPTSRSLAKWFLLMFVLMQSYTGRFPGIL
jgi:hypothetical protein